jgi:hypothetical protein
MRGLRGRWSAGEFEVSLPGGLKPATVFSAIRDELDTAA